MRLYVIACEVFTREICRLAAESESCCDLEFLPKGLHDLGAEKMLRRVQERVDAVPAGRFDAVALGYGLCNNGVVGLRAGATRLVIPRAHDCITLFLGSRERYQEVFAAHPGTYYRTTGWLERDDPSGAGEETVQQRLGLAMRREELVRKYGAENADYLMEVLGDLTAHYDRLAFIRMGLAGEDRFGELARQEAARKGWAFEEVAGSLGLLRRLLAGDWDRDFLVVPPGQTLCAAYDDAIVKAE